MAMYCYVMFRIAIVLYHRWVVGWLDVWLDWMIHCAAEERETDWLTDHEKMTEKRPAKTVLRHNLKEGGEKIYLGATTRSMYVQCTVGILSPSTIPHWRSPLEIPIGWNSLCNSICNILGRIHNPRFMTWPLYSERCLRMEYDCLILILFKEEN